MTKTRLVKYDPTVSVRDLPLVMEGAALDEPSATVVERVRTAIRSRNQTIVEEREFGSSTLLILSNGTAWVIE